MPPLYLLMEAIEHLATIIFMIRMFALTADFIVALTLSLDLLLIVATFLTQRYMDHHLFLNRMGQRLGMRPPYTDAQQRRLHEIFLLGYQFREASPSSSLSAQAEAPSGE